MINKEKDSLTIFSQDVGKFKLMNLEEEKTLAEAAYKGDKSAQDTLVLRNLRLVFKIANEFRNKSYGLEFEELVQEGTIGLMHAAKKFNPSFKTRFSTYSRYWIVESIEKAIRELSLGVRFPANKYDLMNDSKWSFKSLSDPLGDDPDSDTFESTIADDKLLSPEDEFIRKSTIEKVQSAVNSLPANEEYVIIHRFGLFLEKPKSLEAIGKDLGLCKERIRQLEKSAKKHLFDILDGWDLVDIRFPAA